MLKTARTAIQQMKMYSIERLHVDFNTSASTVSAQIHMVRSRQILNPMGTKILGRSCQDFR